MVPPTPAPKEAGTQNCDQHDVPSDLTQEFVIESEMVMRDILRHFLTKEDDKILFESPLWEHVLFHPRADGTFSWQVLVPMAICVDRLIKRMDEKESLVPSREVWHLCPFTPSLDTREMIESIILEATQDFEAFVQSMPLHKCMQLAHPNTLERVKRCYARWRQVQEEAPQVQARRFQTRRAKKSRP